MIYDLGFTMLTRTKLQRRGAGVSYLALIVLRLCLVERRVVMACTPVRFLARRQTGAWRLPTSANGIRNHNMMKNQDWDFPMHRSATHDGAQPNRCGSAYSHSVCVPVPCNQRTDGGDGYKVTMTKPDTTPNKNVCQLVVRGLLPPNK
jgi:hypothetical protein